MKYLVILIFLLFVISLSALIINIPEDYTTIQAGIEASVDGDTVLVQPGTYYENINYNGKNITFSSLFLTTADTTYIYQTVISGSQPTNPDSASVVIFCNGEDSTAVLTGFTLTGGRGTYFYPNGGSYCGGGIYCANSNPSLDNVRIMFNSVNDYPSWYKGRGGGIYCRNSSPSLVNVTISGNSAGPEGYGGGIYCEESSPSLANITISGNSVEGHFSYGGGIYCKVHSSPSLIDATISDNSAGDGAGIWCSYYSNLSLVNVKITGNSASRSAGGLWCSYYCCPSLTNVMIKDNSAIGDIGDYTSGGGIYLDNSSPSLANVTISGNSAVSRGAGLFCDNSSINFSVDSRCNIFSNTLENTRGLGSEIFLTGCEVIDVIVDTFTVINPNDYYATPIDNFTFHILHGVVDSLINSDIYVSVEGDDSNSGISPNYPYRTISHAISRIFSDSLNINTIHLAPGTYSNSTNGEVFPLNWNNYVNLSGNGEEDTILDAENTSGIMDFYRVTNATINNITITNGYRDRLNGGGIYCGFSSPSLVDVTISGNTAHKGGGICCINSNPNIENVTIINNSSEYRGGGGIYCRNSSPSLVNVTISGNSTQYNSDGCVECWDNSNPSLENVTITDNYSRGILLSSYNSSLTNVTITNNTGGGIICYDSSPSLVNVTISGNSAYDDGGGIWCSAGSHPSLINCILWNNSPQEVYFYEDPYYNVEPDSITVSYSDIQGGEAGIVTNDHGEVYWLDGNIDEDPLFIETGGHPYLLLEDSPCIDAGIPDTTGLNLPPWDIIGNQRIWDGDGNGSAIIDMGAYEFQGTDAYDEILNVTLTQLHQNYPNPFNPTTTISFELTTENTESTELVIYNIKGQKIRKYSISNIPRTVIHSLRGRQYSITNDQYSVTWDGTDDQNKPVTSGIYLYKLQVDKTVITKKMILLK